MVAGETQPGHPPAGDIPKTNRAAGSNDAGERRTAGIGCAENTADTGSGNAGDGYSILLQNLQDAEMREPSSEAPAEGQTYTWPRGRPRSVGQRNLEVAHNGTSVTAWMKCANGPRVPQNQYGCTLLRNGTRDFVRKQNSTF